MTNENRPTTKRNRILIIASVAIVLVIGIVLLVSYITKSENFYVLFPDLEEELWCEISEDGTWMSVDTNIFDISGYTDSEIFDTVFEINKTLKFSKSLDYDMSHTTSLDGKQTAENKIAVVKWTYHPNRGLEVSYELKNAKKHKEPLFSNLFSDDDYDWETPKYDYSTTKSFGDELSDQLSEQGYIVTAFALSLDDRLDINVTTKSDILVDFAALATKSTEISKQLLKKYEIDSYKLSVYARPDDGVIYIWDTTDLQSGTFFDYSASFIDDITIDQLQTYCGYTQPQTAVNDETKKNQKTSVPEKNQETSIPEKTENQTESTPVDEVVDGAKFYSRPATRYSVYGVIPYGTYVDIIEYVENGEWIRLTYEGKNAYIESIYYKNGVITNPELSD